MARSGYGFGGRNRQSSFYKEEVKVGKITKQPKGERIMIKRLVVICCILLLPTIAAAQTQKELQTMGISGLVVN